MPPLISRCLCLNLESEIIPSSDRFQDQSQQRGLLRAEFSVCINDEALSRVRVYLYKPFYFRERENAKLRGTILSENGEINKT